MLLGLPPGAVVDAYYRVSTDSQEELKTYQRVQGNATRAIAERYGLVIGFVGDDGGESSKDLERPDLKIILARMRAGLSRGIIVQHKDRLTRNVGDGAALLDEFFTASDGCWIYDEGGPVDTRTSNGRMTYFILLAVSENLRLKAAERTIDTLSTKRDSAELIGRDQFGLKVDPSNPSRSKTHRPNALVKDYVDLASLAVAQLLRLMGWTLERIADFLTRHAFPTKRGGRRWAPSSISKYLLKSPPVGNPSDDTYIEDVMSKVSIAGYDPLPILTDLSGKNSPPAHGNKSKDDV